MTTPWKETTLPTILFKYKLDEIYDADEFVFFVSFFFSIQPENLRFDACVGGKHTKIRLTGLATVNAMGNKLEMFVIGKSRNPCSFVGAKHLPCKYRNKKNAWIEYYSKNE